MMLNVVNIARYYLVMERWHFFLFRPRIFPRALGSVARREPARTPRAPLVLAEVRGTCSGGSKWQVRSERDSEPVEPFRSMQTHVHDIYGTF